MKKEEFGFFTFVYLKRLNRVLSGTDITEVVQVYQSLRSLHTIST